MRWKIIFSFLICLFLFLLQQFLASGPFLINVFAALAVFLSLKQAPDRVWYLLWAGLILDAAYGSWGINLLSLLLLNWLFNRLLAQVSIFNVFARLWLILGGLLVFLLLNLALAQASVLVSGGVSAYRFSLGLADLANYLLANGLLVVFLLLVFRKKTKSFGYEAF